MNPKTKTIIILLTPLGVVIAALWFVAVWNAGGMFFFHWNDMSAEMQVRTMLTLVSAGGFAAMAYFFIKVLRGKPELKKRGKKCLK